MGSNLLRLSTLLEGELPEKGAVLRMLRCVRMERLPLQLQLVRLIVIYGVVVFIVLTVCVRLREFCLVSAIAIRTHKSPKCVASCVTVLHVLY